MSPPEEQTIVRVAAYNLEEPAKAVEVTRGRVPTPGPGQVLVRLQLRPVRERPGACW